MYKKCVTEKTSLQQQQIEKCLLELMKKYPYRSISVSQICEMASVPRRLFYRYFNSKDDALCALIDHTLMDYAHTILSTDDYKASIRQFVSFWKDQTPFLDVLYQNDLMDMLVERRLRFLLFGDYEIEHTFRKGQVCYDEDLAARLFFILSGTISMLRRWHSGGYRMSENQVVEILYRLLKSPLLD